MIYMSVPDSSHSLTGVFTARRFKAIDTNDLLSLSLEEAMDTPPN